MDKDDQVGYRQAPVCPAGQALEHPAGQTLVCPLSQAPVHPAGQAPVRPARQAPVLPARQAPLRPARQAPVRPAGQAPVYCARGAIRKGLRQAGGLCYSAFPLQRPVAGSFGCFSGCTAHQSSTMYAPVPCLAPAGRAAADLHQAAGRPAHRVLRDHPAAVRAAAARGAGEAQNRDHWEETRKGRLAGLCPCSGPGRLLVAGSQWLRPATCAACPPTQGACWCADPGPQGQGCAKVRILKANAFGFAFLGVLS